MSSSNHRKYCSQSCYPSRTNRRVPSTVPSSRQSTDRNHRSRVRDLQAVAVARASNLSRPIRATRSQVGIRSGQLNVTQVSQVTDDTASTSQAGVELSGVTDRANRSAVSDVSWLPTPRATTPVGPVRRDTVGRPERRPPEHGGGMPISLGEEDLIQLDTPIPLRVHCALCGPTNSWAGRTCLAGAIRHFKAAHGRTARIQIECSSCCHVALTVQAAYFHQDKSCPDLRPLRERRPEVEIEIGRTTIEGDNIRLLYPPRPSQCPLCNWICWGTQTDRNGTPTTGVACGLISHLYTHHNKIKVSRLWLCPVCHVTGNGMTMHHNHRHSGPASHISLQATTEWPTTPTLPAQFEPSFSQLTQTETLRPAMISPCGTGEATNYDVTAPSSTLTPGSASPSPTLPVAPDLTSAIEVEALRSPITGTGPITLDTILEIDVTTPISPISPPLLITATSRPTTPPPNDVNPAANTYHAESASGPSQLDPQPSRASAFHDKWAPQIEGCSSIAELEETVIGCSSEWHKLTATDGPGTTVHQPRPAAPEQRSPLRRRTQSRQQQRVRRRARNGHLAAQAGKSNGSFFDTRGGRFERCWGKLRKPTRDRWKKPLRSYGQPTPGRAPQQNMFFVLEEHMTRARGTNLLRKKHEC